MNFITSLLFYFYVYDSIYFYVYDSIYFYVYDSIYFYEYDELDHLHDCFGRCS